MIALLGLVLAGVAGALVALPWWWPAYASAAQLRRKAANVASYRSRIAELANEAGAGLIPGAAASEIRTELQQRLLGDTTAETPAPEAARRSLPMAAAFGVALLLFAVAWYAAGEGWRTQALINLAARDPVAAQTVSLERMVRLMEGETRKHPDDAERWRWLARGYREQERHADAVAAFARARELDAKEDPDLLVEEGEALLRSEQDPGDRFARALALAPSHPRALWYAGLRALQLGQAVEAQQFWERIPMQSLDDEARETVVTSLNEVRRRTGIAAPAALKLKLRVEIAPKLAARVGADDTLFLFAQAGEGGGMPLAARKFAAKMPLDATLDDGDSVMPTRTLSSADRWTLVARVSRSGGPQAAPGDLQGRLQLTRSQAGKAQKLVIDEVVE